MGVEIPEVQLTVRCDGPGCSETGTSTNTADPTPEGWLAVWGPPDRMGRFYFHAGFCYDNWKAVPAEPETEVPA